MKARNRNLSQKALSLNHQLYDGGFRKPGLNMDIDCWSEEKKKKKKGK
jgi:hypothetical protein